MKMVWEDFDKLFRVSEPDLQGYKDPVDFDLEKLVDYARDLLDFENYGAALFYASYVCDVCEICFLKKLAKKDFKMQQIKNKAEEYLSKAEQALEKYLIEFLRCYNREYNPQDKKMLMEEFAPRDYKVYRGLCQKFRIKNKFLKD